MCIGVLYDRLHTRQIADYGGVVNVMPKFAALFLLFSMANAGLPGTSAFVGEFFVILSSVGVNLWIGVAAATALITAASYSLWMYKRVVFGAIGNERVAQMKDVGLREFWMLFAMALLVLGLGVYPKPVTDMMDVSVQALLQHVSQSKLH
jgi:NADH-quinone oxidoreductase subunit M